MDSGSLTPQERETLERLLRHAKAGDHYGLLGIAPDADTKEVQRAYYTLSRQWHPDRYFRRDLGDFASSIDFIFIHITKAYKILNDSTERANYNRTRRQSTPYASTRASGSRSGGSKLPPRPERATQSRSTRQAPSSDSLKRQQERRQNRNVGMNKLRDQVRGRVNRARQYFIQGRKDYEEGKVSAAVSSLHLACQFDPRNAEYKALYQQVRKEARVQQADQLLTTAENAENFQNYREAMAAYEKATKLDPPDGLVFHRLGLLIKRVDHDSRRALQMMRTAVNKSPDRMDFRLDLGDLYSELGMALNARREYQEVLKVDKRNSRARDGLRNLR